MKITIISLDNWGLNKHIKDTLTQKGNTVNHIDFNCFVYKYPNVLFKIYNFFLKKIFKKNLKNIYYGKEIISRLKEINEIQDVILTIKGDFINPESILEFKKYTKKSIGFFNDNTYRCPKIKNVIHCFDEVYSFEKEDCQKFDLKFAPNWIYNNKTSLNNTNFEFDIFNISSIDKRLPILSRIAEELKAKDIKFKFIIYSKKQKAIDHSNITYINKHIPLTEVNDYINRSKVLLDINRIGQVGLTFRVFESLGLQKKLITTNSDIKNYDFYNPNNILIIDEKNPIIPVHFFENEYEKIPESIYQKYTLEGWVENVIFSNLR